jgi:hypothetical protein
MQAAASAADPSDVGAGTAANLAAQTMASRMRYAEPAHFQAERPSFMPQTDAVQQVDYGDGVARASQPGIPTSYNLSAPYPAKYDLPEPFKHRMAIKQALRDTAPTNSGAQLTYQMGEEEMNNLVDLVRSERAQLHCARRCFRCAFLRRSRERCIEAMDEVSGGEARCVHLPN